MSRSRLLGFARIVIVTVILLTPITLSINYFRDQMIIEHPMLDVSFEHSKHKKEQCATCHHNYVDNSKGSGGCYDCHKYSDETILQMESTFHQFCRDCHLAKAIEELDSGPIRQCSLCHIDDQIID